MPYTTTKQKKPKLELLVISTFMLRFLPPVW